MNKKAIVFITIALCWTITSYGQDTVSFQSVFGDSSSVWYIFSTTEGNWAGGTDVRRGLAGDTENVDGTTYNVLRHDRRESYYTIPVYNNDPQLLREDSSHAKLYFRMNDIDFHITEILVMDLGLEKGDTLDTHGWSELIYSGLETTIPTIRIDSVYYVDNRKILRTNHYHESYPNRKDTLFFIEGVGPSFGPYYPLQKDLKSLTCYYKDDSMVYHGRDYREYDEDGCIDGWCSGIENREDNIQYKIFPNPTCNVIDIRFLANTVRKLIIRDSFGNLIIDKEPHGDSLKVNLNGYPDGIYYVTIIDSTGMNTIKVVKL